MALFDFVMDFGNSSREQVVPMTVFVAILCLCLVIGHLLEENRWVNESITAIIIVHSSSSSFILYYVWTQNWIYFKTLI